MKLKRRWRLKRLFFWVVALISLMIWYCWPFQLNLKSPVVLEVPKCPACYGENLCPEILKERLTLSNWTFLKSFLFNAKNTYFGQFRGESVILKKLAHDRELKNFDDGLCHLTQRSCDSIGNNLRALTSLWSSNNGKSLHFAEFKTALPEDIETFSCLRSQDLLDYLVKRTFNYRLKLEHFVTLAFVNPEPLIAMAFPTEENWPFPR